MRAALGASMHMPMNLKCLFSQGSDYHGGTCYTGQAVQTTRLQVFVSAHEVPSTMDPQPAYVSFWVLTQVALLVVALLLLVQ